MKYLYIGILLLFFSCKENEGTTTILKNQEKAKVEESNSKEFKILIEFQTDKTDEFKLMMNNIEIDEFQRKNVHIIEKTQPTTNFENIEANFGLDNISKTILISLGSKEVKNVTIKNIVLKYGDKSISILSPNISEYFTLNKYITQEGDILKTNKVDGKYTPTLILHRKIINELVK